MRATPRLLLLIVLPIALASGASPARAVKTDAPPAVAVRWTAETPDAMVAQAKARALAPRAAERDVVAALATLASLEDRATNGAVVKALEEIGATASVGEDVRNEAAVIARSLSADEGTDNGVVADAKLGILNQVRVLGPFRDTGGGLAAKEGPEAPGARFADRSARYSWGTIEVAWRDVPNRYVTARGVPLDLFVNPRKESCSIVASRVTLPDAKPIVVRLASAGQARLMMDGVELGKSEDVHESAVFDRIAAKVEAAAGDHLVVAKVCSGALDDEGRVRLRITTETGTPLPLPHGVELRDPPALAPGVKALLKVTKTTTALGRTLAGAPGGDLDAQLDAIVARTLGGGEDLKSPRAPGLLDALTRTPGIDPDRLAMAGWIAPSGANRSGWLNLARQRAEAGGDASTRSFCERRLVAEHLTARMPDWAMAALGASKTSLTDHEAVLLRAMTFESLGTDALRIRALRDLVTAFDAEKGAAPTSLLLELAKVASGLDPARELAVREALAARGVDVSGAVSPSSKRGAKAVVLAARNAFSGHLEDTADGLVAARAVSRVGDHEAARALYAELVTWSPNNAEVWAELADELAAVASRAPTQGPRDPAKVASDEAAVTGALRRARELAPGEARYRAELALRTPEGGKTEAREDEKYLVASEKVLARRQGVPPTGTAPDVADRELYWLRAVVMHPDKRVSQLLHYAREIVIAPRTQEELVEDLPTEGDLTEILRARVHRKDGGTAFPLEEHNEGTRPRIRWPELSPGDTVEVAVRNWTSHAVGGRGDPPFYFLDYAGATSTHPLLYNEVVVETLPEVPLYLDVLHGQAGRREDKDEKGKHVTRLVWDKPMTVAEEPLMPALSEVVPVILGSTFKTWQDFRTWYAEAVRGFTEPDAEVRRLAAELTKGKTSRDAKLKALFDFVADDIRYVNYVSGEWWLPNRPQQLLARREGDCDDKAILLITLLKSVGIDAQEVMVQTRETGQPSVLLAKNAAVPMFDHGIAFLPGPNGGTYLDATSPQSRLGPIPSMDARAVALRMDAGPAEIVRLPPSSPDDHGSEVTWTITLAHDGSGDLVGEEKHIGDGAFWLRSYLTQADARAQYVEDNLVGGWFPTVQVDKRIDFNGEMPNGVAWVKYKAHSDGLARHEQKELVVPLSPSQTLASSIAPLVKRTLPVSLPSFFAPSHQRRTIRVIAPPGYVWGELPPGGDENGGEFGNAHLEVGKDPKDARAVLIKRSVVFDMSLIPVEKYAAWRAWIQRVDGLMHKGVRTMPAGEK
jgi:hypothetical protein